MYSTYTNNYIYIYIYIRTYPGFKLCQGGEGPDHLRSAHEGAGSGSHAEAHL